MKDNNNVIDIEIDQHYSIKAMQGKVINLLYDNIKDKTNNDYLKKLEIISNEII